MNFEAISHQDSETSESGISASRSSPICLLKQKARADLGKAPRLLKYWRYLNGHDQTVGSSAAFVTSKKSKPVSHTSPCLRMSPSA